MDILHFNSDSLGAPYAGGQARRAHEINKRLATHHNVCVITAGYPGLRNETIDGVRYARMLPMPHPANLIGYFFELIPRAVFKRPDIIAEDFSAPLTASALPMFTRRPVVGIASYLFGQQAAARYRLPIDRWERWALRKYSYLVALSDDQQQRLRACAPKADVRKIPNGADDDAFGYPWLGDQNYIAFIGRFDWRMKGLDLLLDSVTELPPGLGLRIAGDGPGSDWLRDQIQSRGLGSRVTMVGRLQGAARHEFLAHAKAMAMPSRYENQSLVGLDALAIGVPIVAYDIESAVELFGETARLVPAFDSQAFGRALTEAAADEARSRMLSVQSRQKARAFTWDASAEAQERFYDEIVSRARA